MMMSHLVLYLIPVGRYVGRTRYKIRLYCYFLVLQSMVNLGNMLGVMWEERRQPWTIKRSSRAIRKSVAGSR